MSIFLPTGGLVKLTEFKVFDEYGHMNLAADWDEINAIVTEAVREVFRVAKPLLRPTDTGGIFLMTRSVSNPVDGPNSTSFYIKDEDVRLSSLVGSLPDDRLERCKTFAWEKASRLYEQFYFHQHRSSWISRDVNTRRYGGAVMTPSCILSFSGCPELMDEAIVTCVALITGLCNQTDAEYIASISGNEFFPKLMELVNAQLV